MVKRYTIKLAQKLHLSSGRLLPWLQLLPFLFLIAVLITNTVAWLNGAAWYSSVFNVWLILAWLVGTALIYLSQQK